MTDEVKRYRVKITSGPHAGRFVGAGYAGLVTQKEVQENRPINVPGYGLWAQARGGGEYFGPKADSVRTDMKKLGYETELIQVV